MDERGMGERLREVAELLVGHGVELLAEEPEGVGERDELVERRRRLVVSCRSCESLDEPERAREKSALATVEAVAPGLIAEEERTAGNSAARMALMVPVVRGDPAGSNSSSGSSTAASRPSLP